MSHAVFHDDDLDVLGLLHVPVEPRDKRVVEPLGRLVVGFADLVQLVLVVPDGEGFGAVPQGEKGLLHNLLRNLAIVREAIPPEPAIHVHARKVSRPELFVRELHRLMLETRDEWR